MQPQPLRTTVIGSLPIPGWVEYCTRRPFGGPADVEELIRDAVITAVHDQRAAGLDVITDGEQTRLDFNLSFYGFLDGIDTDQQVPRLFGPPAHDQRGKYLISGPLTAAGGLGAVADFKRLVRIAGDADVALKASVPGPYTMAGRLLPNDQYPDRYAVTEALLPIIRLELEQLVAAGCEEITIDEPSMSCYAYREDRGRLVDIFNRTVETIQGRCRLSTHLCFGNFKGHPVGKRSYAIMFPDFLNLKVEEIHLEMANREFSELELIGEVAQHKDVAVGIVDVKSYYIETVDDIVERVQRCLEFAPADRLAFAPDCGLSQTARWASREKLVALVAGVKKVRETL